MLEFDVAGHPGCDFHFAVTFPYHSADGGSVTLIREYAQVLGAACIARPPARRRSAHPSLLPGSPPCPPPTLQGVNQLMYCLPTGGYDPRKHSDYQACASAELSEEARLAGGAWVPLLPPDHPGIPEIKWGRCVPWLDGQQGGCRCSLPALRDLPNACLLLPPVECLLLPPPLPQEPVPRLAGAGPAARRGAGAAGQGGAEHRGEGRGGRRPWGI